MEALVLPGFFRQKSSTKTTALAAISWSENYEEAIPTIPQKTMKNEQVGLGKHCPKPFYAGCIKDAYNYWQHITTDRFILNCVECYVIELDYEAIQMMKPKQITIFQKVNITLYLKTFCKCCIKELFF